MARDKASVRIKEVPAIFSSGWDQRGSGVGEPVRIVDMQNAWLPRNDVGAVESMPSDSTLIDWSAQNISNAVALSSGTRQGAVLSTEGEWPGETITKGKVGIVGIGADGRLAYANYTDTLSQGSLYTTYTTMTGLSPGSIVRLNDTFYFFQGLPASTRRPQKSAIGSTSIDDIGVDRPDTEDSADINLSLNKGGDNNVVGAVRYWISKIEQGNESALSKGLRRKGDSSNDLYFDGTDDSINWGDVLDRDGTASFTVEFMLKANKAPAASEFLFGKRADLTATSAGWSVHLKTDGGFQFQLDNGTDTYTESGSYAADNTWHRISCVFVYSATAADRLMLVYRDGERQGHVPGYPVNIDGTPTMGNAVAMTAGVDATGDNDFKGRMYDFRIWSEARTQAQIRDLMHESISVPSDYATLDGYWPCDDGSGTTVADGAASNDGTLSAATMWGENESYGDPVINCGSGNRVDINFDSERFWGNDYKIYRSVRSGATPFWLTDFTPSEGIPFFDVQYTGGGGPGTMTISGDALKTYEDGVLDLDLDLTNASYDTIAEVVAAIDGDGNYTCTIDAGATGTDDSSTLVDVSSVDIETTAYTALGTTDDNKPTYTDDIHDDYLGDLPFVHGDQPQPLAIPAVVHSNRIFLAYGSYLYWSDIANEESFWWEDTTDTDGHNETGNWVKVYPDDGDAITALASDHDSIIVFKSNHIYRLYGRRPDDFNLRPLVPSAANPVTVGCPNQNCVTSTPEGLVFYWNRKVYMLRSGILEKISDPIEDSLSGVTFGGQNANDEFFGASIGYWSETEQVWVSLPSTSSNGTANTTYIYDVVRRMWVGYRNAGYHGAHSVRSGSTWQDAFQEEKFIGGLGGVSAGGVVVSIADTPGTSPDDSYATLSPFHGGNLNTLKKFLYLDVTYKSTGSSSFVVKYRVDESSYASVTIDMSGDTANIRYKKRVNINETGRELIARFDGTSTTKWKVLGLVYGYQDHPSISR